MKVFVLNKHGSPLMPCNPRKARLLLKQQKAVIAKQMPFTIQLLYGSSGYKQPVSLGMDAGSKHVGIAAATEKEVLFAEELTLRSDVVNLISTRRQNRGSRRSRKTRYREARFDNRVHSKHKGWLAPSIEVKIQEHITAIKRVQQILPVTEVHVETAEFDTQRMKAMEEGKPLPVGADYQLGEMYDSYNVRQYVLKRDNYTCQCCGKHGDGVKFHVHHLESRKTGGNAPGNLITLCEDCHKAIHAGTKTLPDRKAKRSVKSLRDAAFMGIMRKTLLKRLRTELDIPVTETYGYITKLHRDLYRVNKSHINDAIVISRYFTAKPDEVWYYAKAVRRHNRQIYKSKILKGSVRQRNQAPHVVKGCRLFDSVKYTGNTYFVFRRRTSGYMGICMLNGEEVQNGSLSYKKFSIQHCNAGTLLEKRRIKVL